VTKGTLSGVAANEDPILQQAGLNVRTDYISGIAFRLRVAPASRVQVFVVTKNGAQFFHLVGDFTCQGDGRFHTFVIPLQKDAMKQSIINLVRIDPAIQTGTRFQVDWIGLVSSGTPASAPTPTLLPAPAFGATPAPVNAEGLRVHD
jgi:hypothetical protein